MTALPMQLAAHACYASAATHVMKVRQDESTAIVPHKGL